MAQKKHDETIKRLLQPPTDQPITQPVERSLADFAQEVAKLFFRRGWSLPGGFGTSAETCTLTFRDGAAKKVIRLKTSDIGTRTAEDIVNKYLGPEKDDD
jgi:hypothetical protein